MLQFLFNIRGLFTTTYNQITHKFQKCDVKLNGNGCSHLLEIDFPSTMGSRIQRRMTTGSDPIRDKAENHADEQRTTLVVARIRGLDGKRPRQCHGRQRQRDEARSGWRERWRGGWEYDAGSRTSPPMIRSRRGNSFLQKQDILKLNRSDLHCDTQRPLHMCKKQMYIEIDLFQCFLNLSKTEESIALSPPSITLRHQKETESPLTTFISRNGNMERGRSPCFFKRKDEVEKEIKERRVRGQPAPARTAAAITKRHVASSLVAAIKFCMAPGVTHAVSTIDYRRSTNK
jgi:hypothetical protein